ncbi:hypothetical protein OAE60_00435 [Akkermansiaceae bacterium]|nr:hypothetical protein [Akkermansiaceae bacterium]
MQPDYHIEDLVHQTGNLVVYRVTTRDQIPLALVRLRYDDETLTKLKDGVFESALAQLMQLNHDCLRSVVNGGLDPVDGYPWVAARWWDGVALTDRVRHHDLTEEELLRIQAYSKSLINALGPIAGTVAFTPASIVTCGEGAQTIDTFSIDYHSWFAAFAHGIHPADLVDIRGKYKALTTYLRRQAGLASTSLLTSLEALPSQPEQSIALPSAAKPSPLKILLLLLLILSAVGYFGWKLGDREPTTEESPNTLESAPKTNTPSIKKPLTHSVASIKPSKKEAQEVKITARPKNSAGFARIDPTSPYSLDNKIGKWITFETTPKKVDEKGRLIIPDSEIRAVAPAASGKLVKSALRNKVTLRGFLASPTVLRIVNPDDLIVTYLLQDYYTIDDEPQIRKQFTEAGQVIPVRAVVQEVTKSQSGKTLYLQFKPAPPEFTGRIEKSKAEAGLNETYLKSLIGKMIEIKGRARKSSNGSRLSIVLTRQSQIRLIE